MIFSFYLDPLITRDHTIVRESGLPRAASILYTEEIKPVVVPWSDAFEVEVKRSPLASDRAAPAPNVATVTTNEGRTAVFFVDVVAITPATVRMRLSVDWWGTYSDIISVLGSITRSPSYDQENHQANGGYSVQAVIDDTTEPPYYEAIGLTQFGANDPASRHYVPVVTFTCYENNTWPQADSQPYQVTFISRGGFTAAQLLTSDFQNSIKPESFYPQGTGGVEHTVISVVRVQLVPYDMMFGWGDFGTSGAFKVNASVTWAAIGTKSGNPFSGTYGVAIYSNSEIEPQSVYLEFNFSGKYNIKPYKTYARNSASVRSYIGNRHHRIPLQDRKYKSDEVLGVIYITITQIGGVVFELNTGSGNIDISGWFECPTIYSSEKEAAYNAGSARELSAISSGIGAFSQVAGGVARVAAGDVGGVLSIVSGAVSGATAIDGMHIRGREVISGADRTALSDALSGDGIVSLMHFDVSPSSKVDRFYSVFYSGYVVRKSSGNTLIYPTTSIRNIIKPITSALGQKWGAYTIRAAGVVPLNYAEIGVNLGYLIPQPSADIKAEIISDMARGICVIDDTSDDLYPAYIGCPS